MSVPLSYPPDARSVTNPKNLLMARLLGYELREKPMPLRTGEIVRAWDWRDVAAGKWRMIPHYTTEITSAMSLANEMRHRWSQEDEQMPLAFRFADYGEGSGWRAEIVWMHHDGDVPMYSGCGETLELAIVDVLIHYASQQVDNDNFYYLRDRITGPVIEEWLEHNRERLQREKELQERIGVMPWEA